MKSTKAMLIEGARNKGVDSGCLVQVSTYQQNPDGSWSVAEAVTYVPRCIIQSLGDNTYKLIKAKG